MRYNLSQILITLDRWKNGCVVGPGCLLPIFFLLLKQVLICGSVAVWWGFGHSQIKFESNTNYTRKMEEWLCGGSGLPAANIFFNFLKSIALWQCGGVAGCWTQSHKV